MLIGAARILCGQPLAGGVVFMSQLSEAGLDGAGHTIKVGILAAAGRPADAA